MSGASLRIEIPGVEWSRYVRSFLAVYSTSGGWCSFVVVYSTGEGLALVLAGYSTGEGWRWFTRLLDRDQYPLDRMGAGL